MSADALFALLETDFRRMLDHGPELAGGLLAAALAGSVLGYERELRGSPAGMKTCSLVCIGAAMYMQVGHALLVEPGTVGDPTRMASQIVTGIGFLGAGTIMHFQGGVTGLTSAATVWFIGAVGVIVGCGMPLSGISLAVAVVALLRGLTWIEGRLFPERRRPGPIEPPAPG